MEELIKINNYAEEQYELQMTQIILARKQLSAVQKCLNNRYPYFANIHKIILDINYNYERLCEIQPSALNLYKEFVKNRDIILLKRLELNTNKVLIPNAMTNDIFFRYSIDSVINSDTSTILKDLIFLDNSLKIFLNKILPSEK